MNDVNSGNGAGARGTDGYRDWDAAYVLGALSSEERREYEAHLAECAECAAAVAELAGIPGLLASVDVDSIDEVANATTSRPRPGTDPGRMPADLLPRLLGAARRHRRRTRTAMAGALVAVAAAAASVTLLVPGALNVDGSTPPGAAPATPTSSPSDDGSDPAPGRSIEMDQVVPSPLTADFTLAREDWGSRIETRCSYDRSDPAGNEYEPVERGYALYVTDEAGESSVVATWVAGPGSDVEAVGTTHLAPGKIVTVDIRSLATGRVLLASTLRSTLSE
jgi:hypothetical protein